MRVLYRHHSEDEPTKGQGQYALVFHAKAIRLRQFGCPHRGSICYNNTIIWLVSISSWILLFYRIYRRSSNKALFPRLWWENLTLCLEMHSDDTWVFKKRIWWDCFEELYWNSEEHAPRYECSCRWSQLKQHITFPEPSRISQLLNCWWTVRFKP